MSGEFEGLAPLTRHKRWSMPFRGWAVLALWALAAVGSVRRDGLVVGLGESFVFAATGVALLSLIVWPLWAISGLAAVSAPLSRVPAALVVLAWPFAIALIWLLNPDGGPLPNSALKWIQLPLIWMFILVTPVLTVRWFKVRVRRF